MTDNLQEGGVPDTAHPQPVATQFNRYIRDWSPRTKAFHLKSREWEIEHFARDRSLDTNILRGIAEATLRLGYIPPLGMYGLDENQARAVTHFMTDVFLNMEDKEDDHTIDEALQYPHARKRQEYSLYANEDLIDAYTKAKEMAAKMRGHRKESWYLDDMFALEDELRARGWYPEEKTGNDDSIEESVSPRAMGVIDSFIKTQRAFTSSLSTDGNMLWLPRTFPKGRDLVAKWDEGHGGWGVQLLNGDGVVPPPSGLKTFHEAIMKVAKRRGYPVWQPNQESVEESVDESTVSAGLGAFIGDFNALMQRVQKRPSNPVFHVDDEDDEKVEQYKNHPGRQVFVWDDVQPISEDD